ncbi:MAG: GNAT family N-acetyltransferase [Acidobacteriota bacterium]|nr:GNAT family N-acetyltransferase [Acidobacteriota bacterium]
MLNSSDMNLRRAVPGDEYALSLLGSATFLEAFVGFLQGADLLAHCQHQHATHIYAEWLASAHAHIGLAELQAAPVGYAVLCQPDLPVPLHAGDMELKRFYVLHRLQRSGLGATLMNWAIEQSQASGAGRLLLGVNAQNEKAISFYTRHGFSSVGTRSFRVGNSLNHDLVLARTL